MPSPLGSQKLRKLCCNDLIMLQGEPLWAQFSPISSMLNKATSPICCDLWSKTEAEVLQARHSPESFVMRVIYQNRWVGVIFADFSLYMKIISLYLKLKLSVIERFPWPVWKKPITKDREKDSAEKHYLALLWLEDKIEIKTDSI